MYTYWYPNGVIKLAEAPNIKQKLIKTLSVPVDSAAFSARGKTRAAAALFVTILLIKKVAR
jgi:hypothetical protein